ncbi:hypothetical protein KGQ20_11250 [Catenulispora sp. NF23]|uniref:Uncharacterized protein n=1 Tax=Catenulispora pinistramenti TaxID=2705254 RepID=A0ABS5KJ72_9ACTN|nr:hypothetical protein [Catenulispora pinistramenti]MBS2533350.1 hypothetical protein [Catenulispora pinistramenti]MBS2546436.1 hypothetical protein [Catenulispora pinistramenti]
MPGPWHAADNDNDNDNDADVCALGEQRSGRGRGLQGFAVAAVGIGTGVGDEWHQSDRSRRRDRLPADLVRPVRLGEPHQGRRRSQKRRHSGIIAAC